MRDEMPKNAENIGVYKKQDFDSYVMWKAMPSVWRGKPRQVLENNGIDEEMAISLLEIKNQTEFAKKFGIKDMTTLSEWNKKIEKEGLLPKINAWARKLTPNVIWALYKTAIRDGKAPEVKAWLEHIENE